MTVSAAVDPAADETRPDRAPRPAVRHASDRHVLLGVSHPSDDPSRHRIFEVRAAFDAAVGGWVARVGEQDRNEQRGVWGPNPAPGGEVGVFATAAACLGDAVATIVAMVDRDAAETAEAETEATPHPVPRHCGVG